MIRDAVAAATLFSEKSGEWTKIPTDLWRDVIRATIAHTEPTEWTP